jgi:hypothetical protein
MDEMSYDTSVIWKDGVTDENLEALAEVTEDVAGRLDFFVDKYREGEVGAERLEHLMHLGKRALDAEERLMSGSGYDGEHYIGTEIFGEEINEEAEQTMETLGIGPEEIDLDEEPEHAENEAGEEFLAYRDDPETQLRNAQEQYRSILKEVRDLSEVEVVEPEKPRI